MSNTSYWAAAALAAACVLFGPAFAAEETSKEILAAQLRDQGFKCDKAESATRDEGQSQPNETVWILKCEGDSYRMTLVPDLAAKVEKLGN